MSMTRAGLQDNYVKDKTAINIRKYTSQLKNVKRIYKRTEISNLFSVAKG